MGSRFIQFIRSLIIYRAGLQFQRGAFLGEEVYSLP